ncbi:hypothetical protein HDV00_002420 [Rhizophlyctis rosea]|nr:hypothetical protein HDV00_002420 [Rhizophlyctis rosea]
MDERRNNQNLQVEEDIASNESDLPAQIDALAESRGWFRGEGDAVTTVNSYHCNELTLEQTIDQLATPIEKAYTSANGGRALVAAEKTARSQRQYSGEEQWGPEESLDSFTITDTEEAPTVESLLWDLYYTILHASKKYTSSHDKLITLLHTLKTRPNPPQPTRTTKALLQNWIWSSPSLWSSLILFGPTACEVWNDCPGCGSGWTVPELMAWRNINTFLANITAQNVSDFKLYGIWAIRDAIESDYSTSVHHPDVDTNTKITHMLEICAIWFRIAGSCIHESIGDWEDRSEGVSLEWRGGKLPWRKPPGGDMSLTRWKWWRLRFGDEGRREGYSERARGFARDCVRVMEGIEEQGRAGETGGS